ncbi:hypothetical protein KCTC32516_00125 [Polaribacter huanghezhanensis]|uniref:DUF3307 domain-containing protein n=1 Tax=Polaribacter huanghezhanensis TaxID=1354726 RepID=UPI00264969E2|nr:DUF3307 domain-containing protein [Polaribacter huanghezhanensis]WKD84791.1 hypothetical protein KCTC32516_00125 [Polaribacter huanghezhanensis]
MLTLAIKFILAHLAGDFLFQTDKWIEDKNEKKHKSSYLYWHLLIHFILLLFTLQFDFHYWVGIVIIIVSHYIIDLLKLNLNKKMNSQALFFTDQVLHFIVILGVVHYYIPFKIDLTSIYSTESLLLITFMLITTHVSSVVIKTLISKWKIDEESPNQAGKYIGMLERLFVFSFIILNYWEGIGFLLAAKSVFRFGDLSKAKDRNLTEYILIGTLLSFGIAIATAVGYKYLVEISI